MSGEVRDVFAASDGASFDHLIWAEKVEGSKTKRMTYVIPWDSSCHAQGDLNFWIKRFHAAVRTWAGKKISLGPAVSLRRAEVSLVKKGS